MKKKVALHNLGCKVNSYELEAMQQLLEQAGYEIVPFEPGADVYVINTCTVTNIADRKSRQMLHKAKKMNPDAVVVATGCYVQTDEGKLEKDEAVDLVLGNNQKKNIVEVLADFEKEHQRQAHIIKINQTKEYEELEISRTAEHVRAYIKVQDGCNQFCTYCIIPYARGRVRSREKEMDVMAGMETPLVPPALEPALLYVSRHYAEEILVEQMARSCMMSESHFRRMFTAMVGVSPLEYINRYRIHRSLNLLHSTSESIQNIAARTGFPSITTFNRNFQRCVGQNSSVWRKNAQKAHEWACGEK